MEVFLESIAIEDYDSMASSLIEMGATSKDVNVKACAGDLEKVFSSIKASTVNLMFVCVRACKCRSLKITGCFFVSMFFSSFFFLFHIFVSFYKHFLSSTQVLGPRVISF